MEGATLFKFKIFIASFLLAGLLFNAMTSIARNPIDDDDDDNCAYRFDLEDEAPCVTSFCKTSCVQMGYGFESSHCQGAQHCCCNYDSTPESESESESEPELEPIDAILIPCKMRVPVPTDGTCNNDAAGTFCSIEGYASETSQCLGEGSYCCNFSDTSDAPLVAKTDERVQCDFRVGIPIGETCDETQCTGDCSDYAASGCVWEGSCCCNN